MSNKLPNDLINQLKDDPNFNYEAFIAIQDSQEKLSSIRLNSRKEIQLENFNIDKQIPWCSDGYYLNEMPIFNLDPLFHAGCYYVQEASAMFLDYAIKKLELHNMPLKALDLCAAPGGKSTLINSVLHPDSLIVANEIIKSRLTILNDNFVKWGYPNTVVTHNDSSAFERLPGYFDLLLVDAPSSGSGRFNSTHDSVDEDWSSANIKLCQERQQRILTSALPSLKTDGYLFYSTSSSSKEENEDMLDWIIDKGGFESVSISIDDSWRIGMTSSLKHHARGYRFYPGRALDEGLFFAILKKKSEQPTFSLNRVKMEKNSAPQEFAKECINDEGLYTFLYEDNLHVFPTLYERDLTALQKVLQLKNAGTKVGKAIGKDLVPSHDLALSIRIKKDIQSIDVDLDNALRFLTKEPLLDNINPENLKGWILIRYKNTNLGWIKALPNRINNYYPKEFRIANL